MCMTIATTFTIFWVPYQLFKLVTAYDRALYVDEINDVVEILTYVNSCVNPIVYALMWRPFRLSLIQVRH